jgi:hypothetical protein
MMTDILVQLTRLLIPIMALAIPLVVVTSYFVVQPVVKALTRLAEVPGGRSDRSGHESGAPDSLAQRQGLKELEERLHSIGRVLGRLLEEQEFQRELRSGAAPTARSTGDAKRV